jgi:hypothetical protein
MPPMYLKNAWYVAAWAHELGEAPLDELLRKSAGSAMPVLPVV